MWICKNEKFCLLQLLEIIIRLLLERKEKWTYLRSLVHMWTHLIYVI